MESKTGIELAQILVQYNRFLFFWACPFLNWKWILQWAMLTANFYWTCRASISTFDNQNLKKIENFFVGLSNFDQRSWRVHVGSSNYIYTEHTHIRKQWHTSYSQSCVEQEKLHQVLLFQFAGSLHSLPSCHYSP